MSILKYHNPTVKTDNDLFYHLGQSIDPDFKPTDSRLSTQLRCPAHNDQTPSLKLTVKDGIATLHCFRGCDTKDILTARGLKMADLWLYDRDSVFTSTVKQSQSIAKPTESPETLKSIDAGDTAEKQATRRKWKFYELSEAELSAIEARYGFPVPVLKLLAENEILFKWYDPAQNPCWCLTDGSRHSAQAVRLDGEPFSQGNKKMTLPGSLTSYPIGWSLAVDAVRCLRLAPAYLKQCLFLVCEGVTDYLAGWCLASRFNMVFHFPMVLPLGILGAGIKPTAEIVETLAGCNVRLAFDNDKAGRDGEKTWWLALEKKCHLSRISHHEKNDLRDLWNMVKPGENPTAETLESVKGELIYAK